MLLVVEVIFFLLQQVAESEVGFGCKLGSKGLSLLEVTQFASLGRLFSLGIC